MSRQKVSPLFRRCTLVLLILVGIFIAAVTPSASHADSSSIEPLPGLEDQDTLQGNNAALYEPETASDNLTLDLILFLVTVLL